MKKSATKGSLKLAREFRKGERLTTESSRQAEVDRIKKSPYRGLDIPLFNHVQRCLDIGGKKTCGLVCVIFTSTDYITIASQEAMMRCFIHCLVRRGE